MNLCTGRLRVYGAAQVLPADEPGWDKTASPADRRRSPRIWQMASVAAQRVCTDCPAVRPRSLVVATGLGALDETRSFLDGVFRDGRGNPRNFVTSVHNSMGGRLAQELMIAGPNLTICDAQNSFASAIGAIDLLDDHELPALALAVDENAEILERLLPYLSPACRHFLQEGWRDGAAAFLCAREHSQGPSLRAAGPLPLGETPTDESCSRLAEEIFGSGHTILPLAESSGSFLMPATTVIRLLKSRQAGRFVVPSYAPWANSVAMVEVCV